MGNVCGRRNNSSAIKGERGDKDVERDLTAPIDVTISSAHPEEDAQALYEFARQGKLPEVRELLSNGVGPDEFLAYDGSSALTIAARSGHGNMVKLLVGSRADITTHTDDGSSALLHAVSGVRASADGSVKAVKVLLEARADPAESNEDEVTPLILAGHSDALGIAVLLVNARADVNDEAEGWGTALDAAKEAGHARIIQYLVSIGVPEAGSGVHRESSERKMAAGEKWGYDAFDGEGC